MANFTQTSIAATEPVSAPVSVPISVIVPVRDEAAVIGACIDSLLLQPEIAEILVVNDQSSDGTEELVREKASQDSRVRLLQTQGPPAGWVGKNNAVWIGAQAATSPWLLFTDADATFREGALAKALATAAEHDVAFLSYSPEQIVKKWYEKALVPFVYCRLARLFSYNDINDPQNRAAAAANGQFLLMRREVYAEIGGHAAVAGDLLEDVAIARRAKQAGFPLWFGPGNGIVSVRMYRSFSAMWQGWKKNLYRLVGGTPVAVLRELDAVVPWMILLVILIGIKIPFAMFLGVVLLLFRQMSYGMDLSRNEYPFSYILFYVPGVVLYSAVLWASYRGHVKGKLEWKGREVPVSWSGAAK